MTLRQDISKVIEYLDKKGNFQFQTKLQRGDASPSDAFKNADKEFFDNLQRARIFLAVPDRTDDGQSCSTKLEYLLIKCDAVSDGSRFWHSCKEKADFICYQKC